MNNSKYLYEEKGTDNIACVVLEKEGCSDLNIESIKIRTKEGDLVNLYWQEVVPVCQHGNTKYLDLESVFALTKKSKIRYTLKDIAESEIVSVITSTNDEPDYNMVNRLKSFRFELCNKEECAIPAISPKVFAR